MLWVLQPIYLLLRAYHSNHKSQKGADSLLLWHTLYRSLKLTIQSNSNPRSSSDTALSGMNEQSRGCHCKNNPATSGRRIMQRYKTSHSGPDIAVWWLSSCDPTLHLVSLSGIQISHIAHPFPPNVLPHVLQSFRTWWTKMQSEPPALLKN